MKTTEQRINNIIGQLEGAKKMSALKSKDCFSVLIQLKAVRSAVSSLMGKIVSEELDRCLAGPKGNRRDQIERIFKEAINK